MRPSPVPPDPGPGPLSPRGPGPARGAPGPGPPSSVRVPGPTPASSRGLLGAAPGSGPGSVASGRAPGAPPSPPLPGEPPGHAPGAPPPAPLGVGAGPGPSGPAGPPAAAVWGPAGCERRCCSDTPAGAAGGLRWNHTVSAYLRPSRVSGLRVRGLKPYNPKTRQRVPAAKRWRSVASGQAASLYSRPRTSSILSYSVLFVSAYLRQSTHRAGALVRLEGRLAEAGWRAGHGKEGKQGCAL
jgi:hypothetical protein